jgi:hypothetical protein
MNCAPDDNDDHGRSLVIYRSGLWRWSYSIDGKPAGRFFITRSAAVRAAQKALEKIRGEAI